MSNQLLAAVTVAALIAGIMLTVVGLVGTDGPARPPSAGGRTLRQLAGLDLPQAKRRRRNGFLVAIVLALAAGWLYTGIPMVGIVAAVAVASVPWLFGTGRIERRAIARLEGIEMWTRRLADLVRSGGGLHQAILVSTADAPDSISVEVAELAHQLRSDVPTWQALRHFADQMDDSTTDEVIAALMLNAKERGPRLADVLDRVSESIADLVTMRSEVIANRTDARLSGQILAGMTLGGLFLLLVNKGYMRPYHTLLGQIILAVCIVLFALLLGWMRALNTPRPIPRLLRGHR